MAGRGVSVVIGGVEYRLRSDAGEQQLARVAERVDQTLCRIRDRSSTVDTRDLAMLTALQLARELDERERAASEETEGRIRALCDSLEDELSELRDRRA